MSEDFEIIVALKERRSDRIPGRNPRLSNTSAKSVARPASGLLPFSTYDQFNPLTCPHAVH